MPTNLNALLRYKTIDECLSNPFAKCSIDYLIAKCSDELKESQGIDSGVSERTIRNDLRILRSDILGFNAPIECVDGIYRYNDKKFSLFNSEIYDLQLLKNIQEFLFEEKDNIKQKNNLNYLLYKLSKITGIPIPEEEKKEEEKKPPLDFKDITLYQLKPDPYHEQIEKYFYHKKEKKRSFILKFLKPKKEALFNWGLIFNAFYKA